MRTSTAQLQFRLDKSWGQREEDPVGHWLVVGQESLNELTRIHSQGIRPSQVAPRRNATSPVLDQRDQSVVRVQLFGQIALGQTALLPQVAQPTPRLTAQVLCPLGRSSLAMGVVHRVPPGSPQWPAVSLTSYALRR